MQVSFGNMGTFHSVGAGAVPSPGSVELIFRMLPGSCNPQVARPGQCGSIVRGALHLWLLSPVKSGQVLFSLGGFDGLGFVGQIAVLPWRPCWVWCVLGCD